MKYPKIPSHSSRSASRGLSTRMIAVHLSLLLLMIAAFPGTAYGYTDPGTGALLYQAFYAIALGGIFYLRRIIAKFGSRR